MLASHKGVQAWIKADKDVEKRFIADCEAKITQNVRKGTVAVWALNKYIPHYTPQFRAVEKGGLVSGAAAKGVLGNNGLPVASLRKIWDLSDVDKDGYLDLQEFVIAMFLVDMAKQGHELPAQLNDEMVPPQKRR